METAPDSTPERREFYTRIVDAGLTPLWEVLRGLVIKEPKSAARPHLWRYDSIRPFLTEAGSLITAREATRRVLILENPGLKGQSRITNTLFAGLQMILPGEIAPAHRHTQSALRFVVEGSGAYTAVDGEKTVMRPGDFIITPSWTWHDHGNDSPDPMVWLDGLDIPIVSFFDASFAEDYPDESQPLARPDGDSIARYGEGLMPMGYERRSPTSPVFNYPYARTREALEKLRRTQEWDSCNGLHMRYVNPVDGGWAMPTIGTSIQLLPKGFATAPYRSTDGTVFCCTEGRGKTHVFGPGGQVETLEWGPRDVFVVPSWNWRRLEASEDAVLFAFSDRPVQEKIGLWREARGNA
ncbi:MAG: gentisate 1,2-dioxygenase [Proteobacteria bacterium]|nr:gentisate 1,2-dioxygenase [Pseudomonadota bacterium]